jgi:hypothetical protein
VAKPVPLTLRFAPVQMRVNASVTVWLQHTSLLVRIAKSSRFYQQVAVLKLQQQPEGK